MMAALFDVMLRGLRDTGFFVRRDDLLANARWYSRAIGEPFFLWDHLTGADIPPTATDGPRFVKLTAGDAYNSGLLSDESVSGSAPDITATAVIALADSPLYGQTIHLVGTESRFLRPGEPGLLLGDAIRNIKSTNPFEVQSTSTNIGGPFANVNTPAQNWFLANDLNVRRHVIFDASLAVPTAAENRPRSIGVTVYIRIR